MKLQDLIRAQELEKGSRQSQRLENSSSEREKITNKQIVNKELTQLWNSNSGDQWDLFLKKYWELLEPDTVPLEEKMANLNPDEVKEMTSEEFYKFLHDEYFVWKFNRKNRLATTRMHLRRYKTENRLLDLEPIKKEIFTFDLENTKQGLEIVSRIHRLGIAGASGLLALLFPKDFGTVDQFVVKNLRSIEGIEELDILESMNPEGLRIKDGVVLNKIMKGKAEVLNRINNTDKWTPRLIDMVLWGSRG